MVMRKIISFIVIAMLLLSTSTTVSAKSFKSKINVPLNHIWTVKFNKTLASNQDFSNVIIKGEDGLSIPITVKIASGLKSITITPSKNYVANSKYTLLVNGIKDSAGNKLSDSSTIQFTTVSDNTSGLQTITPEQAEQLVAKNFKTNFQFKYHCIGKLQAGLKIDGKPSEEFYCVYALHDGRMVEGAFYVDSLTGIVYENDSDGCIYRLPDKTFVGMYDDK